MGGNLHIIINKYFTSFFMWLAGASEQAGLEEFSWHGF